MNIALIASNCRTVRSTRCNIAMTFFVRHLATSRLVLPPKNIKLEAVLRSVSTSVSLQGRVVPFKLSDIGEGIREVTVKEWFVKPGDKVSQFDEVCEVQSDKASVTITSRYDGMIKALRFKVDEIALVGQPLVDIELDDEGEHGSEEVSGTTEISPQEKTSLNTEHQRGSEASRESLIGKVLTTPAVRRIAMEKGIRLKDVVGTGKNGRILKEDLLSYDDNETSDSDIEESTKPQRQPDKTNRVQGEVKTVALKGYAKHMWTTMTRSLSIPHFVYSDECDVTKLVKLRDEVKAAMKERGIALTYMPFFIKAISKALEKFPELNARLNEDTQTVEVLPWHNICVAMDTPEGLVVPNVKNVQNLDVVTIAKELNRLQELGKRTAIPPSDLAGGTFTLSNIGVVGGTYTKPVILPPQIVIGAVGRTQKLPRFDADDKVVAAQILSVSWAADHRVVDGATIAKFSNLWKYYLENPALLVMN
ncbi:lipoamide acyltransferase component of branched-chain alpha-keto acid dehydrogenase complex, mitochondrial isoform X1 [Neodiprion lecontei]|uniref:Dihydrolipoamide acetyltransferase component of pyruvate dehydrogenase complex n=1 Tax=Neodiprion lecontei TaxID=441921 RepID=A0A6J0B8W5_NEOLC|nr:lipoamide acyltransferase component of branched-chain alpha-keto acid dehydrogenase complex, mitochondrial isoform X1 [Neodiprion lecontei]